MGDVHRDLVLRACRWLEKTERCTRVFAEVQSTKLNEFPDAIGYHYNGNNHRTIVVEAKASVADFKRDASKGWKAPLLVGSAAQMNGICGMGTQRYYIVPEGLIAPDLIPEDHGLLHALPSGKVKRIREAPHRECRDVGSELSILCTMLQRYELGMRWLPAEFRFETRAEFDARVCLGLSSDQKGS